MDEYHSQVSISFFCLMILSSLSSFYRNRFEKLSLEETEVVSMIKDLYKKARLSYQMSVPNFLADWANQYGNGIQVDPRDIAKDVSTLASFGRTLQQNLSTLVHRLRGINAKAQPQEPGCCGSLMNLPGCVAGVYLKRRLFRFTSLLKATRGPYSELGSQGTRHISQCCLGL